MCCLSGLYQGIVRNGSNMEYELHELDIKDYNKIRKYFDECPARTCEGIINSIYIWREYYNVKYIEFSNAIAFLCGVDGERFMTAPICKKECIKSSVEEMRRFCHDVLKEKISMPVVDENVAAELMDMQDIYDIKEDRDSFDYVYDANKLRTLSGKAYHKKKNHLNSFLKEYEGLYECRVMDESDEDIIMGFLEEWYAGRTDRKDEREPGEKKGIERLFKDMHILSSRDMDLKMFGVFIEGKLKAFTMGTYHEDYKTVYVHVEKADPEIRGLYTFINRQFQIECFPEAEYVNREDDLGLEGLRQAKMTYNPIFFEKKYWVKEK